MSFRVFGVLAEVCKEREKQDGQWGIQDHPDGTDASYKAFADAAKAACQIANVTAHMGGRDTLCWRMILSEEVMEAFAETDSTALRAELVQVAAVAVAWIEAIDRRGRA